MSLAKIAKNAEITTNIKRFSWCSLRALRDNQFFVKSLGVKGLGDTNP